MKEKIDKFNNLMNDYRSKSKERDEITGLPLLDHISKTVKLNKNDSTEVPAYLKFAGVVFDDKTCNFHIFPKDPKTCQSLGLSKDLQKKHYAEIAKVLREELKELEEIKRGQYKLFGGAGTGKFSRLYNIEKACDVPEKERFAQGEANFYKYVGIKTNDASYTINFMRYTFDGSKVGCTFNEIQFHKDQGNINEGKDGRFSICYPKTALDSRDKATPDDYIRENSAGNICWNPPVDFEDINEIIRYFRLFIENTETLKTFIDNKKTNEDFQKWIDELQNQSKQEDKTC